MDEIGLWLGAKEPQPPQVHPEAPQAAANDLKRLPLEQLERFPSRIAAREGI